MHVVACIFGLYLQVGALIRANRLAALSEYLTKGGNINVVEPQFGFVSFATPNAAYLNKLNVSLHQVY